MPLTSRILAGIRKKWHFSRDREKPLSKHESAPGLFKCSGSIHGTVDGSKIRGIFQPSSISPKFCGIFQPSSMSPKIRAPNDAFSYFLTTSRMGEPPIPLQKERQLDLNIYRIYHCR
jgi:hypothetical protein